MEKKIAILRGINVGGKRRILMADLKLLFESFGLKNVVTYIQSGNVIFDSDQLNSELENLFEKGITEKFGFDVPVIVRSSKDLEKAIQKNPFYDKMLTSTNCI
jgi:uncharacterized protein (DUF1697 family)